MIKTTAFENIGFGKFAKSRIEIIEEYTSSNDYECTTVIVDGMAHRPTNSTRDALAWALDEETASWIARKTAGNSNHSGEITEMVDCISREDVITEINYAIVNNRLLMDVRAELEALPSVQPKERTADMGWADGKVKSVYLLKMRATKRL